MTHAEQLADFVRRASFDDISEAARVQLKIRILDSLGCAIGALGCGPLPLVRSQVEEFDGKGNCTLIGGGRAAPDRASFYNGALVRYLESVAAEVRAKGVRTTSSVERGEPRAKILGVAQAWHADVIVLGSDQRTRLAGYLSGGIPELIARRASCSVEIVRATQKESVEMV